METHDLFFEGEEEGMPLKIYSKKLPSGKCQVKFYAGQNAWYGYVLVEPGRTLRDVVKEIQQILHDSRSPALYYQQNLYNLAAPRQEKSHIMLFRA